MSKNKSATLRLPSQHQIDDIIIVSFDININSYVEKVTSNTINFEAVVKAVHFYPGKVKYDIEIETPEYTTRIYNLDSILLFKRNTGINGII